jgi:hypothetical protein
MLLESLGNEPQDQSKYRFQTGTESPQTEEYPLVCGCLREGKSIYVR